MLPENVVIQGDCVEETKKFPSDSIELVCSDPPFNIDFSYDVYEDKKSADEYLRWTYDWGCEMKRVLKPSGTFWLAIGDAFASELDVLFRKKLGFHRRNWVIWSYSFGVNCKRKFTPSHTHLFYYVKDPKNFTFNAEAIKVPSARMAYGDKRAKVGGRLPDDTWVLQPKYLEGEFGPDKDTWLVSRVCGTFNERVNHPCQMPLAILERIVKVSSNPGDTVLDPFAGSGTTLVAAKKFGRKFIGVELSENYCQVIKERLVKTNV